MITINTKKVKYKFQIIYSDVYHYVHSEDKNGQDIFLKMFKLSNYGSGEY